MNSNILILPVIRIEHSNPDWREQYDRERQAARMNALQPPPRTRPIVVVQRPEPSVHRAFMRRAIERIAAEDGQLANCQRPEGER